MIFWICRWNCPLTRRRFKGCEKFRSMLVKEWGREFYLKIKEIPAGKKRLKNCFPTMALIVFQLWH